MEYSSSISPRSLWKDPDNPLPGQVREPVPVEIRQGEQEWALDSIRSIYLRRHHLEYRANWLGADEEPEYYLASNFIYALYLLKKFYFEHWDLPGQPQMLSD